MPRTKGIARHEQSETLPLFAPSDPTRSKHGGNPQSEAAFERVKVTLNARQKAVCSEVFLAREHGATAKEVAAKLKMPLHAISGRFTELKKAEVIFETEHVREGSRVCVHGKWRG